MDESAIQFPPKLISSLRTARQLTVLTGAGISAESGVPTFRDAQTGLWSHYNPQDLATPDAFRRDPQLVWDWYTWRRDLISKARPNPGHNALVEIERQVPAFKLITQNVDHLHWLAGNRSMIELHGNIWRTKCFEEDLVIDSWPETGERPPRCPRCGGLLRPDAVWFGESLPAGAIEAAMEAARTCDIFFSIGTSALVQPAASLPLVALEHGAALVEVNPDETALTGWADYVLRGPSGQILPALVQEAWGEKQNESG